MPRWILSGDIDGADVARELSELSQVCQELAQTRARLAGHDAPVGDWDMDDDEMAAYEQGLADAYRRVAAVLNGDGYELARLSDSRQSLAELVSRWQ
jgi:hypothetical protein